MERRKRYLLGNGDTGRTLRTHGEGGTNGAQTRDQVVATIVRWNREGRLRHNYTESKDSTQIRFDLQDGSRVAITKPINPYTPETLLVTAFETPKPTDKLTAQYIYEKPEPMQYKYWQTTFAQMLALKRQTPLETVSEKPIVNGLQHAARYISGKLEPDRYIFFMENTGPLSYIDDRYRRDDLEGFSPRTSRTGADIHLHVAAVNEPWLTPGANPMPNLDKERQMLRNLQKDGTAEQFLLALGQSMKLELPDKSMQERFAHHVAFILEEGFPVGYSLQFKDITERNILKNIDYVSKVLKAHFQAYQASQQLLFGDGLLTTPIPQPSFRTYGAFEKGKRAKDRTLTITIAPQVFSHGGPLEAAGVELQRSPEFASIGTEKQKEIYRRRLTRTTKRLMRDRRHEVGRTEQFTEPEWQ